MSRETMLHLNTQTLIGMTDIRGNAWTFRRELQGAESNHYPMAVPIEDVRRRLLNWTPVSRRMAMEVPADMDTMTHFDASGNPWRWAVQEDIQGVARDDTNKRLGIFGANSYKIHEYDQWLLQNVETILGQGLAISSAGLLKGGGVCWVEISMPENMIVEGVEFRPNLLATTTCDGSGATTYKLTIQMTVCDNTREIALSEDSPTLKVQHSSLSLGKLSDVRDALALVDATGRTAVELIQTEVATPVTDIQFKQVLSKLVPIPEKAGRAKNNAERKTDELLALWNNDPRVSPWKGTEFGAVQAFNTWHHHLQSGLPQGSDDAKAIARGQRNMLRAVDGSTAAKDAEVIRVLEKVLAS
jgi:phage/plasmid-like protein (TIGR03299 family)